MSQKQYHIEIFTPETAEEFEQLWQLNHQVFASELKMRSISEEGKIVDKFHHKNIYRAARVISDGTLAGMISAHWRPPYSAAAHFGESVVTPPAEGKLAEIRLFALLPQYRSTTLASQLAVPLLLELESQGIPGRCPVGLSPFQRAFSCGTGEPDPCEPSRRKALAADLPCGLRGSLLCPFLFRGGLQRHGQQLLCPACSQNTGKLRRIYPKQCLIWICSEQHSETANSSAALPM